jgi:hypothetical protein
MTADFRWPNFATPYEQLDSWVPLIRLMDAMAISAIFALMTACYYITYHHTVLTMPHIPEGNLRVDFLIAISQAGLFGLSIIFPKAFPIFLGISLYQVARRQWRLHLDLALALVAGSRQWHAKRVAQEETRNSSQKDYDKAAMSCFRAALVDLIRVQEFPKLPDPNPQLGEMPTREEIHACAKSWLPAKGIFYWWAFGLILVVGIFFVATDSPWLFRAFHRGETDPPQFLIGEPYPLVTLISFVIHAAFFGMIYRETQNIIRDQSAVTQPRENKPGYDPTFGYDIVVRYVQIYLANHPFRA